jgi:hypothetical protein
MSISALCYMKNKLLSIIGNWGNVNDRRIITTIGDYLLLPGCRHPHLAGTSPEASIRGAALSEGKGSNATPHCS